MNPAQEGRSRLVLASIGLAGLAFAMMQSLVVPVLPTIQHELGSSPGLVTWVLTGYLLSASIATPVLGRTGDIVGKKRVLVITLAVLCAGTVCAALAQSMAALIAARLLQGVGGALFPLSFGIIRDQFAPHRVAGAIGFVSSTLAFGGGLGVVLAGPIVAHLDYHWLFWIPAPLIAVAAVVIALVVPETTGLPHHQVSWSGAVSLAAWLVALLLGITEGPRLGWDSWRVLALLAAALALIAVWWRTERRGRDPLIDPAMLTSPTVLRFNLVALMFGFVLYSSFRLIPEFLQSDPASGYGFGADISESGLYLLPQTIIVLFLGLLAGRIATVIGSTRAVLLGSLVAAIALGLMAVAHSRPAELLGGTALLGVGIGLTYAAIPAVIVEAVPPDQTGVATGVNTNVRTIGGALGSQATAAILSTGVATTGVPAEAGFTAAFALMAVLSLFAALAASTASTPR
jgi:MFS family permease